MNLIGIVAAGELTKNVEKIFVRAEQGWAGKRRLLPKHLRAHGTMKDDRQE